MLVIRNKDERGVANFGWLNSRHTSSFGEYHDQRFMGFGPLRVINEDRVAPARGFDTHGRRGWLQLIRGEVEVDGAALSAGDGLSIEDTEILKLRAITSAELLVFDMA